MKTHVTQSAIDQIAVELKQARFDMRNAETPTLREYFGGKTYGIIDTFATVTRQTWIAANDMLTKRGEKL